MSTPTGLRNNNYLNLKNNPSNPWLDANGASSRTDGRGHAIFTNPAYGVRAGIKLLKTYFIEHGLKTILQIISRWAPPTDTIGSKPGNAPNDPGEYSRFVSGQMGAGVNERLELFDSEGKLGDLAQLKGLFFAMAAFEIGNVNGKRFQVPEKDWLAGLELMEPGITKAGTESTDVAIHVPDSGVQKPRIRGSVGAYEQGAKNDPADVEVVQRLLRDVAMVKGNPQFDPGGLDGKIAKKAKDSDTVKAIIAFQSMYFAKPDGLIEVDGRTWRELLAVVNGGAQVEKELQSTEGVEVFPFAELPKKSWTESPRSFGANRANNRAHAGCDLYFPKGTIIHAVADGTVVRGPYPFYAGTFALEIDHGAFTARYGEIQEKTFARQGDRVKAGDPIARVGHLVGIAVESDMLHFELYSNKAHGPLTVPASEGLVAPNGRPYMRRKDLIDPTPKLNTWKNNLPQAVAAAASVSASAAKSAKPARAGIPGKGFCIHLRRIRQETRSGMSYARTIGEYQCYWNGEPMADLIGQIVEREGPGDNTFKIGNLRDRRIKAGTYRLAIQDGAHYKTYGYTTGNKRRLHPMPGILLQDTGERTAILIHRGEDYVNSVGCLNPASGLTNARSKIDFDDSRDRVIGFIEAMKIKLGARFPKTGRIPDAIILIEGEPTE